MRKISVRIIIFLLIGGISFSSLPFSFDLFSVRSHPQYLDLSVMTKSQRRIQEIFPLGWDNLSASPKKETQTEVELDQLFKKISSHFKQKNISRKKSPLLAKKNPKSKSPVKVAVAPVPGPREIPSQQNGVISNQELVSHYGFKVNLPIKSEFSWVAYWDGKRPALNTQEKEVAKVGDPPTETPVQLDLKEQVPVFNLKAFEIRPVPAGPGSKGLALSEDKGHTVDEVNLVQSDLTLASQESQPPSTPSAEDATRDDLVFYDYSQLASNPPPKKVSPAAPEYPALAEGKQTERISGLVNTRGLPPSVYQAIQREMNIRPSRPPENSQGVAKAVDIPHSDLLKKLDDKYPKLMAKNSPPQTSQMPEVEKFMPETPNARENVSSVLRVKLREAELEKGLGEELSNFDLRPHYSFTEVLGDHGEGELLLENSLNEKMSVFGGSIFKHGKIITNVDFTLEKDGVEYVIPSISTESLDKFLTKYHLIGNGGFLLVELDDSVEKVDIDGGYEAKVFLDNHLKVVEEKDPYTYVFYIGLRPGNKVVTFTLTSDEMVRKIIHINDNELYFEMNSFYSKQLKLFELFESKVFGKFQSELNITPGEMEFFNGQGQVKRRGLNRYEISNVKVPMGSRIYLELKHLEDSIFIGTWSAGKLQIPSTDYINQIFNTFGIDHLNSQCLIQINLGKPGRDFLYEGKAQNGLNLKTYFLEKDGSFSDEISERAAKIFLLGDNQGVINGKLEYMDGSVDFFNTICSNDTYLIEQW